MVEDLCLILSIGEKMETLDEYCRFLEENEKKQAKRDHTSRFLHKSKKTTQKRTKLRNYLLNYLLRR